MFISLGKYAQAFTLLLLAYSTTSVNNDIVPLGVVDVIQRKSNVLLFLGDKKRCFYVLKVSKRTCFVDQVRVLRGVFASLIADSVGIKTDEGSVVPINGLLATLHSFVVGKDCASHDSFEGRDVKQKRVSRTEPYNVDKERGGLTMEVIRGMSFHAGLQAIVALDTYTGNSDRSNGNLLYDDSNDVMYAIDHDHAFSTNLCACACYHIGRLIKRGLCVLSERELEGLKRYRDMLKRLCSVWPHRRLCREFDKLCRKYGLYPGGCLFERSVVDEVARVKMCMKQSYKDALHLVELLDKLINLHHRRQSLDSSYFFRHTILS